MIFQNALIFGMTVKYYQALLLESNVDGDRIFIWSRWRQHSNGMANYLSSIVGRSTTYLYS
jgi:hypothetical protein